MSRMPTSIIALAVLSFLLLTGCQSLTDTESNKETADPAPVKLRVVRRESVFQPINLNPETRTSIRDAIGIDILIEPVPSNNFSSKLTLMLVSENVSDLIELGYMDLLRYGSENHFAPLDQWIETSAPNFKAFVEKHPELNRLKIDDKWFGFPITSVNSLPSAAYPVIRSDLLEQLNFNAPGTCEELLDLLIALKAAYPDQAIWVNQGGTRGLISNVSYPLGSGFSLTTSYYFEDSVNPGRYKYGPAHQEFIHVLQFLRKAYQEKVLDPFYSISTVDEWQQKLSSGEALFYYDFPVNIENFNLSLRQQNPNYHFAPLLNLKNITGESRVSYQYQTHAMHRYYVVPAKSENIEAAVKLIDWLYSEEGTALFNYGIQQNAYTITEGKMTINPELFQRYHELPFGFRLMQYERGTGQGFFTPSLNMSYQYQIQPELELIMKEIENSPANRTSPLPPPLTKEEAKRVAALVTKLDQILFKEIDQYIVGEKSLDAYDTDLRQKLINTGSEELEQLLNQAHQRALEVQN
ncbi:extracellular solute-binding protein [Acidaminobacter hydrogenoformans]|uniref:ABC-type glycerol-3-phosphate transport system, substrate-binding protein n=1 Tax=Acidaminobacter hydrogenoformans DSM 2784 TaxID=1120920 RepID=A0A1G5S2Z4_9FIRM|nr:extracellular solute-binding protein [Acidaminobacter hydrogenoformans]SCZ80220.1 ABC-type glycerol-3-phosphate transport system, substrate-binding protein [Acidaminobacter hydrogenoformans DSM 2784]